MKVEDKDLHACHCMERRGRVIVKFKDCKLTYQVMPNKKKLPNGKEK